MRKELEGRFSGPSLKSLKSLPFTYAAGRNEAGDDVRRVWKTGRVRMGGERNGAEFLRWPDSEHWDGSAVPHHSV